MYVEKYWVFFYANCSGLAWLVVIMGLDLPILSKYVSLLLLYGIKCDMT